MITFDEAFAQVMSAAPTLGSETVALQHALGRVLTQDVHSDIDMPPFDKSAMDGYACMRKDLASRELTLAEEIAAGAWPQHSLQPGTCARVFTGAPIPRGADCVVMQEQTVREGTRVRFTSTESADNLCPKGEDFRKGDLLIRAGTRIRSAHIAVLASVGVWEPRVARQPRVAVMATGSELVEPHQFPAPAQIRNSNGWQLLAQAHTAGALTHYLGIVPDNVPATEHALRLALEAADVLLLSGGVSTGDFDLAPRVMRDLGFTFLFESVAMQPGRPTVFAHKDGRFCFGLPGNPVSTYVIFELLVRPFLGKLMGCPHEPLIISARLTESVRRTKTTRQSAFPVRFVGPGEVAPLAYHGSAHIHALTRADGLLIIPLGQVGFEKGEHVLVRSFSA